jgi:hypothetical protein
MMAQGIMDKKAVGNMHLTNCCITDDRKNDLLSIGNADSLSIRAQSCKQTKNRKGTLKNFVQSFIHTQRACRASSKVTNFRISESINAFTV